MLVKAISDMHMKFPDPASLHCDLLLIAGDSTNYGTWNEIRNFGIWLEQVPAKNKVFIAGNHDILFEKYPNIAYEIAASADATYLQDEVVVIENRTIYGTPWVDPCWGAFNTTSNRWAENIPFKLDILLTHTPPLDILDFIPGVGNVGSLALRDKIRLSKIRRHIFGHIHESGDKMMIERSCWHYNVATKLKEFYIHR